jgi:SAM-dependent methyltransferase
VEQASVSWGTEKVGDFNAPTAAPASPDQHDRWQSANRAWWEAHPMRYDWRQPVLGTPDELDWFREIDQRLFGATVLPAASRPFEPLLPREFVDGKRVLEVGVGMGSHAQILAEKAREFVGIDLTRPAVSATKRRLQLTGARRAAVLQMDAERLAFPDAAFDLVWSWGVIHHSASTRRALEEIRRVLKPDGCALVMVYHRALIPWLLYAGLIRGFIGGGIFRSRGIHRLVQGYTDGALARYYTRDEWRREISGLFEVESLAVYGNRGEALPMPGGRLKDAATSSIPQPVLRFWLSTCRQGTLLFSRLRPRHTAG